jgi:hypothetical protein
MAFPENAAYILIAMQRILTVKTVQFCFKREK